MALTKKEAEELKEKLDGLKTFIDEQVEDVEEK